MTTHKCDGCGSVIESSGTYNLPRFRFFLAPDRPCETASFGNQGWSPDVVHYTRQFNTTGISYCKWCVLKAFAVAVNLQVSQFENQTNHTSD